MLDVKAILAKILNALRVSETVTFTACGKDWVFRKIGNIVWLDAPNDSRDVAAGSNTIGTLPSNMRPAYIRRVTIGNGYNINGFLQIDTQGLVQFYSGVAASGARNCSFSTSFIARGGYFLTVFSRLSRLTERRWEYVRCKGYTGEDTAKRKNSAENLFLRDKHNKNNRCIQTNYCTDNIGIYLSYVAERDHIGLGWGIGNRKPAIFNNGRLGGGNGKRDRNTGEHSGVRSLYKRRPCIALERGCLAC